MRTIFCVLCVAICSGTSSAQEYLSNFDACVSEARRRHTDSVTETYFSYKCDGIAARRLAARPDQCTTDVRPSRNRIERTVRQMDDGLYLRTIWRTGVCAGMCETRRYNDARAASYLCEVRRHIVGVPDGPARYPGDWGSVDEYAPPNPGSIGRWVYREHGWRLQEYDYGIDEYGRRVRYRRDSYFYRHDDTYRGDRRD